MKGSEYGSLGRWFVLCACWGLVGLFQGYLVRQEWFEQRFVQSAPVVLGALWLPVYVFVMLRGCGSMQHEMDLARGVAAALMLQVPAVGASLAIDAGAPTAVCGAGAISGYILAVWFFPLPLACLRLPLRSALTVSFRGIWLARCLLMLSDSLAAGLALATLSLPALKAYGAFLQVLVILPAAAALLLVLNGLGLIRPSLSPPRPTVIYHLASGSVVAWLAYAALGLSATVLSVWGMTASMLIPWGLAAGLALTVGLHPVAAGAAYALAFAWFSWGNVGHLEVAVFHRLTAKGMAEGVVVGAGVALVGSLLRARRGRRHVVEA